MTASFLRACVQGRSSGGDAATVGRLLPALSRDHVLSATARHRVAGLVSAAVQPHDAEGQLATSLRNESRRAVGVHLRALAEVQLLRTALVDVPWLIVKGPVLAGYAYPRPEQRAYSDVDALVSPSDLGRAVRSLEGHGFAVLDQNWDKFLAELPGEVHLRSPLGGILDLHWHIQNDSRSRDGASIATRDLLARARSVDVSGIAIGTLDAEDSLLHVALHAARSGGHRLVWLKDVQQLWLRDRPDPRVLADRAAAWGIELPLALMLMRTQHTLRDPEIGRDVLALLRTDYAWRPVFRAVDALAPVAGAQDGHSLARVVARAAATDPSNAAAEGLRRVLSGLSDRASTQSALQTWDPQDPHSVVFPSGGAEQREAYFKAVARRG